MKQIPRKAQFYIFCVWLLGAGALCLSIREQNALAHQEWLEWLLLLPLSAVLGAQKICLYGSEANKDANTLSLSFLAVIACLLWLGPLGGVCAAILSCLGTCLTRRQQPVYQVAFNVALASCEALACALVFRTLNGGYARMRLPESLPATWAVGATSFFVSGVGVASIVALVGGPGIHVQLRQLLWALPSYVAGASVCLLGTILFHPNSQSPSLGGLITVVAPVAILAFQAFRIYVSREEEKHQRIAQLQESQRQLSELYLATIRSLALAIDAKDQYTHQHILRVQRYALAIAQKLGVTGDEMRGLETGALLHDIGKLGVPEYILLKPGKLTAEEFAKIKQHPEIGAAILEPVPFPWPVLPIVKHHHEKWDGTGYPCRLKGEDIPYMARILAVADVYDALTSSRSYRGAWSHEKACEAIRNGAGTHFDPQVAEAFLEIIDGLIGESGELPRQEMNAEARIAHRIHRASAELWALFEVTQTLAGQGDPTQALELVTSKLEEVLPGISCLILLPAGDGALRVQATVGPNHVFFQGTSAAEGGVSRRALDEIVPYRGEYVFDDIEIHAAPMQWASLSAALIVPLHHDGRALGTINLYHSQPDAFSADDEKLLERIAEHIAQALARQEGSPGSIALSGDDAFRAEVQQRCQDDVPFTLLRIQLGGIDAIQRDFGRHRAQATLEDVAAAVRTTVRGDDFLSVISSEELGLILRGVTGVHADAMLQRIRAVLQAYSPDLLPLHGNPYVLESHIGSASFPEDGRTDPVLLALAATTSSSEPGLERRAA